MIADHRVYIVAAIDQERGIGKDNNLPWRLKKEIAYFKKLTTETKDPQKQNMVIMGRTTWESLPTGFRPLPQRRNVVLSRQEGYSVEGAEVVASLDEAFELADEKIESIFVIGGASIYQQVINHSRIDGVYLTELKATFDCDAFFPEIPPRFKDKQHLGTEEEKGIKFEFLLYF